MSQNIKVLPQLTPWSRPFWEGAKRHQLMLQKCHDCGQLIMYPKKYCQFCLSDRTKWIKASGRGKIYSFTIVKNNPPSPFLSSLPYIIAIVRLEEEVQLLTNIVASDPDAIGCELNVEVVFDDISEDISLPKFRLVNSIHRKIGENWIGGRGKITARRSGQ